MSAIPELDVQRALPVQSDLALAYFTTVNPSWRGAEWADCLSVLVDSDSHLEVTEPVWESLNAIGFINDENRRYITPVTITLLRSTQDHTPPSPFDVQGAVTAVLAYVEASKP